MRPLLRIVAASLLTASLPFPSLAQSAGGPVPGYPAETPERALHAMVVSVQHLATDAGLDTLEKHGNAVDAAVATAFTLAVVYPFAGNLGGGGFMLIHLSGANGKHAKVSARDTFLDFRETAPAAATSGMYLDHKGDVIPGASTIGRAPSGCRDPWRAWPWRKLNMGGSASRRSCARRSAQRKRAFS